jgi:hypothetical protein
MPSVLDDGHKLPHRLAFPNGLPPALYLSSFGWVAHRVALFHLPQAPARFGALFNLCRPISAFAGELRGC